MPWRSLKHAYFMSISENCHTKGEVGYVYSIITSPTVTFSRIFLDKRKAAAYDHCRAGSEIVGRGRKATTQCLRTLTSCHLGACHLIIKLCSELYSKVIVGVVQSTLTPDTCFWFFWLNYMKSWLSVSYFLLILKSCESWELHRIHKTYRILYSVFINPCENSFSL